MSYKRKIIKDACDINEMYDQFEVDYYDNHLGLRDYAKKYGDHEIIEALDNHPEIFTDAYIIGEAENRLDISQGEYNCHEGETAKYFLPEIKELKRFLKKYRIK